MQQLILFLMLFSVGFLNCTSNHKTDRVFCQNSIYIKTISAQENKFVENFELYETTNYPEGIIMKIESVSNKYQFKDSAGRVCIPILADTTLEYRKFVFVKSGYVYTEHYLKNAQIDTVLKVTPLKEKGSR
jgi:hypothetical protein